MRRFYHYQRKNVVEIQASEWMAICGPSPVLRAF